MEIIADGEFIRMNNAKKLISDLVSQVYAGNENK